MQAKPKWYMGFSDNTNFTFLLTTICDVASIYAPCAASFGMEPWHEAIQDAYDVLTGKKNIVKGYPMWEKEGIRDEEHPLLPYNLTEKRELYYYIPGVGGSMARGYEVFLSGRLIGGCMDCLVNLTGTSFDKVAEFQKKYRDDGILWFLESCDLNVMSIRRAMWHMKQAGWFENTKGFLIGRPLQFGQEMMGLDQYLSLIHI